jgi:hypothetical protein
VGITLASHWACLLYRLKCIHLLAGREKIALEISTVVDQRTGLPMDKFASGLTNS